MHLSRELAKIMKFSTSKINVIDDVKIPLEPISQNSNNLFKAKDVAMMNSLSMLVVLIKFTSRICTNNLYSCYCYYSGLESLCQ